MLFQILTKLRGLCYSKPNCYKIIPLYSLLYSAKALFNNTFFRIEEFLCFCKRKLLNAFRIDHLNLASEPEK